jgi:hypothetical protein
MTVYTARKVLKSSARPDHSSFGNLARCRGFIRPAAFSRPTYARKGTRAYLGTRGAPHPKRKLETDMWATRPPW